MKIAAFILSFLTIVFFMNCGQNANFASDEVRFKSLVDGDTIEIVSENDLDTVNEGDGGLTSNDGSEDSTDGSDSSDGGGVTSNDDSIDDDDSSTRVRGNGNRGRSNAGNSETLRDRILQQDKEGKHDEMITSPEEMANDSSINKLVACGKDDKKILVCHHPSGNYAKRKTCCLPPTAVEAIIGHKHGENYAGACLDEVGAPVHTVKNGCSSR